MRRRGRGGKGRREEGRGGEWAGMVSPGEELSMEVLMRKRGAGEGRRRDEGEKGEEVREIFYGS